MTDVSEVVPVKAKSSVLYTNFILFCVLYAVAHSTVNVVTAFASAELGIFLGAFGGFSFYGGFTISSLLIAKPVVRLIGVKNALVIAMTSFCVYVGFFTLSLFSPNLASVLYVLGACVGGLGEGLFWTGQGIYYSMNSIEYSQASSQDVTKVMSLFSSIFAVLFLSIEALSKIMSTVLLSIVIASASDGSANSWRVLLFAFYTVLCIMSAVFFYWFAIAFTDNKEDDGEEIVTIELRTRNKSQVSTLQTSTRRHRYAAVTSSNSPNDGIGLSLLQDCRAVSVALCTNRLLQYITPFQLAFGLNGVFLDSYVCGVIVKNHIGVQYIGVLSGLLSITSVLVTAPYYYLAYYVNHGKYYVMMFGAICFASTALPVLLCSNATIGHWYFVSWLFIIHGCARGAWENTNKAVLGEYFALGSASSESTSNVLNGSSHHHEAESGNQDNGKSIAVGLPDTSLRDTAFAAACFTSGFAGAIGYLMFEYVTRTQLAILNVAVGGAAALGFHLSARLHGSQKAQHEAVYTSVEGNSVNRA